MDEWCQLECEHSKLTYLFPWANDASDLRSQCSDYLDENKQSITDTYNKSERIFDELENIQDRVNSAFDNLLNVFIIEVSSNVIDTEDFHEKLVDYTQDLRKHLINALSDALCKTGDRSLTDQLLEHYVSEIGALEDKIVHIWHEKLRPQGLIGRFVCDYTLQKIHILLAHDPICLKLNSLMDRVTKTGSALVLKRI